MIAWFLLLALLLSGPVEAQQPLAVPLKSIHPQVAKAVEQVSEERVAALMKKLEGFGTRNLFSDAKHPTRGKGAAYRWIESEFKSYSPRLEVRLERTTLTKSARVWRDVELVNVVAVLKGKVNPEREIVISGHYDSLNRIMKPRPANASPDDPTEEDFEKTANADAPGVNDDGSGTAAVMELARVMSAQEWDNTLVFIAFDGEEYGLLGARYHVEQAKKAGRKIEAVLNNDIIGSEVTATGRTINRLVNVYSNDPNDSKSRQLARYIRDMAQRYTPGMDVNPVFRADRFGRGGDHTPFDAAGFAAVRFTTPAEDLPKEHTANDTFANASPAYTTRVARVNLAAAASLALAPGTPLVSRTSTSGSLKGRTVAMLTRGKGFHDAVLKWNAPKDEADLAGYAVVMRSTIAPYWEREWYVGNVTEFTLKDTQIDDCVLGVKAIDKEGNESLVAAYVITARDAGPVQTKSEPAAGK
jgi:hypothetical protein